MPASLTPITLCSSPRPFPPSSNQPSPDTLPRLSRQATTTSRASRTSPPTQPTSRGGASSSGSTTSGRASAAPTSSSASPPCASATPSTAATRCSSTTSSLRGSSARSRRTGESRRLSSHTPRSCALLLRLVFLWGAGTRITDAESDLQRRDRSGNDPPRARAGAAGSVCFSLSTSRTAAVRPRSRPRTRPQHCGAAPCGLQQR